MKSEIIEQLISSNDLESNENNVINNLSDDNKTQNNNLQLKDFMLLDRIVKKINSILDKSELLKQIVQDVSKTLGFTRCAVLLYHENSDQLEIAALTGWEDDKFYPGYKLKRNQGIVWKAVREQRIIYFTDVLDHPDEIPCDFTSRSHVDIPLYHHNKFIGILNAQNIRVDAFSRQDLRLLKTLASHISIAIENSRLFENEKKEKEIMQNDLIEAKTIQKRLFPKKAPEIPNFSIKGMCKPCYQVGGDWFDYIELPYGKIGVVLADVSGKGLSAALLMSSARTIFRMVANIEESPSRVLTKVNEYLIEEFPTARFMTMLYLIIDITSGKIIMANAGHMWPVHKTINKINNFNFESGFPLGIQSEKYKDYQITLKKGEKLFLYSDGVTEAMNSNEQFFEDEELLASLQNEMCNIDSIYNDLKNFVGNSAQNDDITIVEIEKIN
ncbi:MAG TPA: GAF domain-containing SpoIIE family protein phosphatase [Ignavibacteriaceae bacterium]|nr:GAF domain-containing SpoIIE family protein phosphatase [Ignavibacteriaceae bacterium]